eukprot:356349-Chlamydomonas_euryale.AAC.3
MRIRQARQAMLGLGFCACGASSAHARMPSGFGASATGRHVPFAAGARKRTTQDAAAAAASLVADELPRHRVGTAGGAHAAALPSAAVGSKRGAGPCVRGDARRRSPVRAVSVEANAEGSSGRVHAFTRVARRARVGWRGGRVPSTGGCEAGMFTARACALAYAGQGSGSGLPPAPNVVGSLAKCTACAQFTNVTARLSGFVGRTAAGEQGCSSWTLALWASSR